MLATQQSFPACSACHGKPALSLCRLSVGQGVGRGKAGPLELLSSRLEAFVQVLGRRRSACVRTITPYPRKSDAAFQCLTLVYASAGMRNACLCIGVLRTTGSVVPDPAELLDRQNLPLMHLHALPALRRRTRRSAAESVRAGIDERPSTQVHVRTAVKSLKGRRLCPRRRLQILWPIRRQHHDEANSGIFFSSPCCTPWTNSGRIRAETT